MKTCTQCAEPIQDKAVVCRYCGAKQKQGDGKLLLILIGVVLFFGALMSTSNSAENKADPSSSVVVDTVVAEPHDNYLNIPAGAAAPEEKRGRAIAVWSDPKATYTDEGSGVLPNGRLWLTTRRAGPSGVTFSKREIDCAVGSFRYMEEGVSLESMSPTNDYDLGPLTEGSISTLVSDYACRKHGRGRVTGVYD